MADNTQNQGGVTGDQNPDQQKRPESPSNSQKNAYRQKRFRYAKKVKEGQAKGETKQKIDEIKPRDTKINGGQNTNQNNVNRNRNQVFGMPGHGDGRGGVIGRLVMPKQEPVKQEPVGPKPELPKREPTVPKQEPPREKPAQSINPFLVDFTGEKKQPEKQKQEPARQEPAKPKQEPQKSEPQKQQPAVPKQQPPKQNPAKPELPKREPIVPKQEPIKQEPPQEKPAQSINPFLVDFTGEKKQPEKQKQEPARQEPAKPKQEPQKSEPQKQQPAVPKTEPQKQDPFRLKPEPVQPKREQRPSPFPVMPKPQEQKPVTPKAPEVKAPEMKIPEVKMSEQKAPEAKKPEQKSEPKPAEPKQPEKKPEGPVNPFMSRPAAEVVKNVRKEDLEPADEGDEDLDNEIPSAKPKVFTGEVVENPFQQKPKVVDKVQETTEKKTNIEGGKPKGTPAQTVSPGFSAAKTEKVSDDEGEDLSVVLAELGITKKRAIYFCGGIVTIVVVVMLAIFGWNMFSGPQKIPRNVPGVVSTVGGDYGVKSTYLLGIEFSDISNILKYSNYSGILTALDLGGISFVGGQFSDYMSILRQMQNIYDTDVYALIDSSPDRREVLEAHLATINDLLTQGENIYYEINSRMAGLSSQYDLLIAQQTQYENSFFIALRALQSQESSNSIDSFISVSQNAVKTKAFFGAYKSFKAMFANSVNALKPRYEDIMLNKEAILKGVYIFDVPGSDIGTIIRLNSTQVK